MVSHKSSKRRVVITGIGVISPIGIGKDLFWQSLRSGRSGVSPITAFDASQFTTRFAGEIRDFDPVKFIEPKRLKRMDRTSQFAVA